MLKRLLFAALFSLLIVNSTAAGPALSMVHTTYGSRTAGAHRGSSELARAIANRARQQAMSMCSVGLCYRGVKRALNPLGIALAGDAAWQAKNQLCQDGRFCQVPMSNLSPGDILVHGRSSAHPYGHIAVYLGNGQEASDHVQHLVIGGGYGNTVVFRARHGSTQMARDSVVALSSGSRR